ncbi:hypothetical protein DOT_2880 [Desulfosporosinus sp. OT]|nr:hypothetical protein DOT_2880 [Desulfosporosinus sp. OT]
MRVGGNSHAESICGKLNEAFLDMLIAFLLQEIEDNCGIITNVFVQDIVK